MESIVILENVQSIGEYALRGWPNFKEVYYPAGLDISSAGINYSNNNTSIISYIENNDGTIAFTIENCADGVTTVSLPKEFAGKTNAPATTMDVTCINTVVSVIAKTNNHSFDGGVVTTQASETQKGVKTYTCTVCGTINTEEIPMIEVPAKEDVVEPEVTEPAPEEVTPEEEKSDEPTSTVVEAEIVEKSNFNIWFVIVPSVIVLGAGEALEFLHSRKENSL